MCSFDVEVFLYDEVDENKMTPLKFKKDFGIPDPMVEGDILRDQDDQSEDFLHAEYEESDEPHFVEYFFDIRMDKQVPEEDICNGVAELSREDIFVDLDVDCIERDEARDVNIYSTRITDIEEC